MPKIVALTLPYARYPFVRALEGIAEAGYEKIGIRTGLRAAHAGEPIAGLTTKEAHRVRALCADYGLTVSMLFGAAIMKESEEDLCRHIDFARDVGADSVLWVGTWGYVRFPDEPHPAQRLDTLHREYVAKLKPVAAHAEKQGVVITLKPHTGNTATGPILKKTLDDIGSAAVRASYDPGNVYHYEGPEVEAEADFEHVKDVSYSFVLKDHHKGERPNKASLPGDGRVDFVRMLRRLREVGFDGPLVVEKVHDRAVDGDVSAEDLDERMKRARANVLRMWEEAGSRQS